MDAFVSARRGKEMCNTVDFDSRFFVHVEKLALHAHAIVQKLPGLGNGPVSPFVVYNKIICRGFGGTPRVFQVAEERSAKLRRRRRRRRWREERRKDKGRTPRRAPGSSLNTGEFYCQSFMNCVIELV